MPARRVRHFSEPARLPRLGKSNAISAGSLAFCRALPSSLYHIKRGKALPRRVLPHGKQQDVHRGRCSPLQPAITCLEEACTESCCGAAAHCSPTKDWGTAKYGLPPVNGLSPFKGMAGQPLNRQLVRVKMFWTLFAHCYVTLHDFQ